MPDIKQKRSFPVDAYTLESKNTDFFLAGLRVAHLHGCTPIEGYDITITSDIPVNAGVSSSSALVVAWIHFLLKAFGNTKEITPEFIAQLAYEAEVVEHNSPGGKMDQYTIAIGNTIFLETGNHTAFEKIDTNLDGLILAESGLPKSTIGTLKNTRDLAEEAIKIVKDFDVNFNLYTATLNDIERYRQVLDAVQYPYFESAIKNHCITQEALQLLKQNANTAEELGRLMTLHHQILGEKLQVSAPKIDHMLDSAIRAGAYGGKIVGSGGGGCAVALAPKELQREVIDAFIEAGATKAYAVTISNGSLAYEN